MATVKNGNIELRCDICGEDKAAWYVDGKTAMGPWGMMCPSHFRMYGVGLGTGRGQKYDNEGNKIAG